MNTKRKLFPKCINTGVSDSLGNREASNTNSSEFYENDHTVDEVGTVIGSLRALDQHVSSKRQCARPSGFGSMSTIGHQVSFVETGSHAPVKKRLSNVVATGISNENVTFKKQCIRSTDFSSVSHTNLQEPVSCIRTSEHQLASSGHIGYSDHSSSGDPIATNVSENNMGDTVVGDRGVVVQLGHMDLRAQQSNGGLSERRTASARNVYRSSHSPRGDRNTTTAYVNIIAGVITSTSSDRTSNTVGTVKGAIVVKVSCMMEKTLFTVGPLHKKILEFPVVMENLSLNRTVRGGSPRDNDTKRSRRAPESKSGCLLVRQCFFHNDPRNSIGNGGGVVGCRDASTTMIVKPGKVVDFLLENQNVRDIKDSDWTKARRMFTFKQKNGNNPGETIEIRVFEYYLKHRDTELKESRNLPCLDIGKPKRPVYIALKLCELISLQRDKRLSHTTPLLPIRPQENSPFPAVLTTKISDLEYITSPLSEKRLYLDMLMSD
ncbi:putative PAZ domain-containing protein [Tanacetum coccineum]